MRVGGGKIWGGRIIFRISDSDLILVLVAVNKEIGVYEEVRISVRLSNSRVHWLWQN